MNNSLRAAAAPSQARRWRSPLAIATLSGLLLALLTGSTLLFVSMVPAVRDFWVLAHWALAMLALVPYALYQWRHYQRVRPFARQTHYRVGLQAFFLVSGAALSGLLLVTPLRAGTTPYSIVDLLHIFFSYAFTLLLSAHLTLVAMRTLSSAQAEGRGFAAGSIRTFIAAASAAALVALSALVLSR
jgi:hypothetical protein